MGVQAALIDIDGVLVTSWEALPGAAAAIRTLRSEGIPTAFLTNTTSRSSRAIVSLLQAARIDVRPDEVLTAAVATAAHLRSHHRSRPCWLLSDGDLGDDLRGIDWVADEEPAEVVVLGGAGPSFTWERRNHALALLLGGADLVAMHRSMMWTRSEGPALDTGAELAALEAAAEVDATVCGKPEAAFFRAGAEMVGVEPERCLMIGDDIRSDVLAAQEAGMTGALVRTGKYRPAIVDAVDGTADHVIDSVADLPALLGRLA